MKCSLFSTCKGIKIWGLLLICFTIFSKYTFYKELILFNCNKFYGLFAEKIVRSDSLVMGFGLFCKLN